MMRQARILLARFFLILVLVPVCSLQASDLAKEKRWAEQIVDSILDGEAVWLPAGQHQFLAIHTESEEQSDWGIIVVHGTGVHPNWDQVVRPVRVEMTTRGWHTLSIQAPILHNEATYEEYVPLYPEVPDRIRAAEDYLRSNGVNNLVLVAHSQGSAMSAYYLAQGRHSIKAFVAVGVQAAQKDAAINVANSLRSIHIPVLDLYGSDDLPGVLQTAAKRGQASAHNPQYSQQVITGAEHFFDGKNDELLGAVTDWLSRLR